MIAIWILYTLGITVALLVSGLAAEYIVRAFNGPTRAVWLATIALAITLSGLSLVPSTRPPVHEETRWAAGPQPTRSPSPAPAASPTATHNAAASVAPTTHPDNPLTLADQNAIAHAWRLARHVESIEDPARYGSWDRGLVSAWATLTGLILAYGLVAFQRLRRLRRRLSPHVAQGTPVWLSENVGPAVLGVIHTRIVLPTWVLALPEAEQQAIITHEKEHARVHDPAWLLLAFLLIACQPWNIALWLMRARLRFAMEADCDARVVRHHARPAPLRQNADKGSDAIPVVKHACVLAAVMIGESNVVARIRHHPHPHQDRSAKLVIRTHNE